MSLTISTDIDDDGKYLVFMTNTSEIRIMNIQIAEQPQDFPLVESDSFWKFKLKSSLPVDVMVTLKVYGNDAKYVGRFHGLTLVEKYDPTKYFISTSDTGGMAPMR